MRSARSPRGSWSSPGQPACGTVRHGGDTDRSSCRPGAGCGVHHAVHPVHGERPVPWDVPWVRVRRSALLDLDLFQLRTFSWGHLAAAMAVGAFISDASARHLAARFGAPVIVLIGLGLEVVGVVVLALLMGPSTSAWLVALPLVGYGVALRTDRRGILPRHPVGPRDSHRVHPAGLARDPPGPQGGPPGGAAGARRGAVARSCGLMRRAGDDDAVPRLPCGAPLPRCIRDSAPALGNSGRTAIVPAETGLRR